MALDDIMDEDYAGVPLSVGSPRVTVAEALALQRLNGLARLKAKSGLLCAIALGFPPQPRHRPVHGLPFMPVDLLVRLLRKRSAKPCTARVSTEAGLWATAPHEVPGCQQLSADAG